MFYLAADVTDWKEYLIHANYVAIILKLGGAHIGSMLTLGLVTLYFHLLTPTVAIYTYIIHIRYYTE